MKECKLNYHLLLSFSAKSYNREMSISITCNRLILIFTSKIQTRGWNWNFSSSITFPCIYSNVCGALRCLIKLLRTTTCGAYQPHYFAFTEILCTCTNTIVTSQSLTSISQSLMKRLELRKSQSWSRMEKTLPLLTAIKFCKCSRFVGDPVNVYSILFFCKILSETIYAEYSHSIWLIGENTCTVISMPKITVVKQF